MYLVGSIGEFLDEIRVFEVSIKLKIDLSGFRDIGGWREGYRVKVYEGYWYRWKKYQNWLYPDGFRIGRFTQLV